MSYGLRPRALSLLLVVILGLGGCGGGDGGSQSTSDGNNGDDGGGDDGKPTESARLILARSDGLEQLTAEGQRAQSRPERGALAPLAVDTRQRRVWAVGSDALIALSPNGETATELALPEGIDDADALTAQTGVVWLAQGSTLYRFTAADGQTHQVETAASIQDGVLSPDGEILWVLIDGDLKRRDPETGAPVASADSAVAADDAPLSRGHTIATAPVAGGVWIATEAGVRRHSRSGERQERIARRGITQLIADGAGGVWVIDAEGVARLDASGAVRADPTAVVSDSATINDMARAEGSGVWLATDQRLIVLDDAGARADSVDLTNGRGAVQDLAVVPVALALDWRQPSEDAAVSSLRPALRFGLTPAGIEGTLRVTRDGEPLELDCRMPESGRRVCHPEAALPEGELALRAQLRAAHGGRAKANERAFTVDTQAPELTVGKPANGFLTDQPELEVSGELNEAAEVRIDGSVIGSATQTFTTTVTLSEGTNEVTVTATDAADNTTERTLEGVLDTEAPRQPDQGAIDLDVIGEKAILVGGEGAAAPRSTVTVTNARTGESVTAEAGDDGSLRAEIAAEVGDELRLVSRDDAGNTSSAAALDTSNEAPAIAALEDREVSPGNRVSFRVMASDPDGDAVEVDMASLPLPDNASFEPSTATFRFRPSLAEVGTHELVFTATDGRARTRRFPAPSPGAPRPTRSRSDAR